MARKEKMVTRTMEFTKVTFMAINLDGNKVESYTADICGKLPDATAALDAIKGANVNPKIVPSIVTNMEVFEELYGMTESEFLRHSKKLPPRVKTEDEESNNS